MDRYLVIGDPVKHSLSPRIHAVFAEQTGEQMVCERYHLPAKQFSMDFPKLLAEGVKGFNVTLPLKGLAFEQADQASESARVAKAASFLHVNDTGLFAGNFDGQGLLWDLERYHGVGIADQRVLICGAGGAVRGLLTALQAYQPAEVVVANRTVAKAQQLAEDYGVLASGYEGLTKPFDIIINGTSASVRGEVLPIPSSAYTADTFCYDMMYAPNGETAFTQWAQQQGMKRVSDGLGMLIQHNTEVFALWRGVQPDPAPLYAVLRV